MILVWGVGSTHVFRNLVKILTPSFSKLKPQLKIQVNNFENLGVKILTRFLKTWVDRCRNSDSRKRITSTPRSREMSSFVVPRFQHAAGHVGQRLLGEAFHDRRRDISSDETLVAGAMSPPCPACGQRHYMSFSARGGDESGVTTAHAVALTTAPPAFTCPDCDIRFYAVTEDDDGGPPVDWCLSDQCIVCNLHTLLFNVHADSNSVDPSLSGDRNKGLRELLISGTHDECWKAMMSGGVLEDEDDDEVGDVEHHHHDHGSSDDTGDLLTQ
jgi:hypothetical protein